MNAPTGFTMMGDKAVNIHPIEALFNPAWFSQALHMVIAAFESVGFAVVGIHAFFLLKFPKNTFHQKAIKIAIWFAVIAAFAQVISGDHSAKDIAKRQPLKLAAAESDFKTQTEAPLRIGGIVDMAHDKDIGDIEVPGFLSFLAFNDPHAKVKGLEDYPRADWPPVPVTHYAFEIMVSCGSLLLVVGFIFLGGSFLKKGMLCRKWFLKLLVFCTPLGFIALEAGWTVTETGRQPWIIYGVMKTKDALTPMPGLIVPFMLITAVYLLLSVTVTGLMVRQFKAVASKVY
jgi:cytochrome d ubiquinol oxidase subunit I